MASSGSFSNSIVSGHYKLKVDWSQAQNVSANTSTITCRLYLINDWSLGIGGGQDKYLHHRRHGEILYFPFHIRDRHAHAWDGIPERFP